MASRAHERRYRRGEARVEHQARSQRVALAAVQPNKRMQQTGRGGLVWRASRANRHQCAPRS
jgi:hypothetical protein